MKTEHQCSFCGKRKSQARSIIAGAKGFICDECVSLCVTILKEQGIDIAAESEAGGPG